MVDRQAVNDLVLMQETITGIAMQEAEIVLRQLNLDNPDIAREQLLEVTPPMVDKYTDMSATAAAEWYEREHPSENYYATIGEPMALERSKGLAVASANKLVTTGTVEAVYANTVQGLELLVALAARFAIAANVKTDRDATFARVPSGGNTCAFCLVMSSRGFAYTSRESAGDAANKFHAHCKCQIVPSWKKRRAKIKGYDPDAMYQQYQAARKHANSGNLNDILSSLRTLYPDSLTDGHAVKAIS